MVDSPRNPPKRALYVWGIMLSIAVAVIVCLFAAVHDLRFTSGAFACGMIVLALVLRRARQPKLIQILLWLAAAAAIGTALIFGPNVHS